MGRNQSKRSQKYGSSEDFLPQRTQRARRKKDLRRIFAIFAPFAVKFFALLLVVGVLGACRRQGEAEITRVVTQTVVTEGERVEVTRVVVETIVE